MPAFKISRCKAPHEIDEPQWDDQEDPEPKECPDCFSSMTQKKCGRYDYLQCDSKTCTKIIELENDYE